MEHPAAAAEGADFPSVFSMFGGLMEEGPDFVSRPQGGIELQGHGLGLRA